MEVLHILMESIFQHHIGLQQQTIQRQNGEDNFTPLESAAEVLVVQVLLQKID